MLEVSQDAFQSRVRLLDSRLPVVPTNLLALTLGRVWVIIATVEEIAHVEVCMSSTARMHIDVHELRHPLAVEPSGKTNLEPGLLPSFSQRGRPRRLAGVDMPARLQPEAQPLVFQQHHAPRPHHQRRASDVGQVRLLRKRRIQPVKRLDKRSQ